MTALFADWALLPQGWCANVRVEIDAVGRIASVSTDSHAQTGDTRLANRWMNYAKQGCC